MEQTKELVLNIPVTIFSKEVMLTYLDGQEETYKMTKEKTKEEQKRVKRTTLVAMSEEELLQMALKASLEDS